MIQTMYLVVGSSPGTYERDHWVVAVYGGIDARAQAELHRQALEQAVAALAVSYGSEEIDAAYARLKFLYPYPAEEWHYHADFEVQEHKLFAHFDQYQEEA